MIVINLLIHIGIKIIMKLLPIKKKALRPAQSTHGRGHQAWCSRSRTEETRVQVQKVGGGWRPRLRHSSRAGEHLDLLIKEIIRPSTAITLFVSGNRQA
jgi:hypothetical protein